MTPRRARLEAAATAALALALAARLAACGTVYPPPRDGSVSDARRADARGSNDAAADITAPDAPGEDAPTEQDTADPVDAETPADEGTDLMDAPAAMDVRTDVRADTPALTDARADVMTDVMTDARADVITDVTVSTDARPDATTGTGCPDDMVAQGAFCIDRYEAPNERGASPLAMQTAIDGERWCAARGRRLCSEVEWVSACQGASMRRFPYGTTYVRGRCVDDKTWRSPNWTLLGTWPSGAAMNEARRLYQAEPSGAREGCASEDGVMDLTGNVAEWVTRSFPNANNYAHVMRGCYWAGCYGGSPPSCTFVNPAHPGTFRTYEAGFRCCTERAP